MTAVTSYAGHVQRAGKTGKTTNDGRSKTSMKTTRKPKRTVAASGLECDWGGSVAEN